MKNAFKGLGCLNALLEVLTVSSHGVSATIEVDTERSSPWAGAGGAVSARAHIFFHPIKH